VVLTFICLRRSYIPYELSVVPSDRDVRTRSSLSRNVDLETRYVIVGVGACCGRGGGKRG
jgi:hypothetical protein